MLLRSTAFVQPAFPVCFPTLGGKLPAPPPALEMEMGQQRDCTGAPQVYAGVSMKPFGGTLLKPQNLIKPHVCSTKTAG